MNEKNNLNPRTVIILRDVAVPDGDQAGDLAALTDGVVLSALPDGDGVGY